MTIPYCFETHKVGKMDCRILENVVRLAERLVNDARAEYLEIVWYGEEPLLAPDVIDGLSEQLIELAQVRSIRYSPYIITNGCLLRPQIADLLGRCHVEEAQITLDGIGVFHDATRHLAGGGATFDRIVGYLKNLKPSFKVKIRHTVHAGNLEQVQTLQKYVEAHS